MALKPPGYLGVIDIDFNIVRIVVGFLCLCDGWL